MAHIIGMVERVVKWFQGFGKSVEFCTYEQIAATWLAEKMKAKGRS